MRTILVSLAVAACLYTTASAADYTAFTDAEITAADDACFAHRRPTPCVDHSPLYDGPAAPHPGGDDGRGIVGPCDRGFVPEYDAGYGSCAAVRRELWKRASRIVAERRAAREAQSGRPKPQDMDSWLKGMIK